MWKGNSYDCTLSDGARNCSCCESENDIPCGWNKSEHAWRRLLALKHDTGTNLNCLYIGRQISRKQGVGNMVELRLKDGQSGYDVVSNYICKYWDTHVHETVIVSIGVSFNGQHYDFTNEVAYPNEIGNVVFLDDWWEGQRFVKISGIKAISELNFIGGQQK